ncbi:CRISPR-associated endonuclease Cas1 [Woodsholea maritima]|uniref:CRISPR-associated endonuclease Cas1 n=1 Tax=Woodsholea maritima TaxID=240237 RepID=UPI0003616550|nr:CRISPR-associated endonuclease Cas1 [Woodsholea maritima]
MMRLEACLTVKSLMTAWKKVYANQGGPGGDGQTLAQFQRTVLLHLHRLGDDVRAGLYMPGPHRVVSIPKRAGGWRSLSIPCVRDRVLQTAVAQRLQPILEPEFEPESYGYRPGRSVAQAIARVATLRRQGFRWTVDADIERFFDCVPHGPLLERLRPFLGDPGLVGLVEMWLAGAGPHGRGLPQGSPISPLLANLYLDDVDEGLKSTHTRLVRFADDFVILTRNEDEALQALERARGLLDKLGLSLNLEKTRIVPFEGGLDFLGRKFVRALVVDDVYEDEGEALAAGEPARTHARAMPGEDALDLASLEAGADTSRAPRLRVLYLLEKGHVLGTHNSSFTVRNAQGDPVSTLPTTRVDRIEVGSQARIADEAIRLALDEDVEMRWINGRGQTEGYLSRPERGHGALHLAQLRLYDNAEARLAAARILVEGRLRNQRALLRRLNRRRKRPFIAERAKQIGGVLKYLPEAQTIEALMGREGQAGALYWPALGACLEHGWTFTQRVRRPPPDPVNLVLSYLASLLCRDIASLAARQGLHVGIGALHAVQDEPRDTLAFDLAEEFRAPLVEGLCIWMLNTRTLGHQMFHTREDGQVYAHGEGIKTILRSWENWLDRPVRSPRSGQDVLWRGLIEEQILCWRDHVSGKSVYQPYRMEY